MSKYEYISWIIVIGLAIALFFSLFYGRKVETREIKTTDTIVVFKIDTVKEQITRYITERVVDTVYLPSQISKPDSDSFPLLITQKHYSKPNLYELWVSGYEPKLDSINIYQKTEYHTITNETIKEIYPKVWSLYANVGFQAISDTFCPMVGLTLATPKNWAMTINLGLYDKDLVYGAQVQYKILGKISNYGKKNRRQFD